MKLIAITSAPTRGLPQGDESRMRLAAKFQPAFYLPESNFA